MSVWWTIALRRLLEAHAGRWQVESVLRRGYAVATAYYGDIELDPENPVQPLWRSGLRAHLSSAGEETVFQGVDWGTIGAWAYGFSRILDYLEQETLVDAQRVAVMGHSRLGKTALWAGATDERFAMVISNNSGQGGAALTRHLSPGAERIADLAKAGPYWFCRNYERYAGAEEKLPVDAHMLLALIAPRPLYIASATEDVWANPMGESVSKRSPRRSIQSATPLAITCPPENTM